jgi:fructoselysine-6-P-deglycase FrlB-like protein
VVDADGSTPYAKVLEELSTRVLDGETVVVFLAQPAGESSDLVNALALLRARRVHLYAIIFECGSFADKTESTNKLTNTPADAQADATIAMLHELDAYCLRVRRGDDLVALFNT